MRPRTGDAAFQIKAVLDPLVGMFVNTLVLRTAVDPGKPFAELLDRVRGTDLDAFAHADVPFESVVEAVDPVRSEAFAPLAQVMLSFNPGASVAEARAEVFAARAICLGCAVAIDMIRAVHAARAKHPKSWTWSQVIQAEGLGFGLVAAVLVRGELASGRAWLKKVDNTPVAYNDAQNSLDDTLRDSRWDMPYLGMQVLVEGLALAAFGVQRDLAAPGSLGKQVLAYVMQDEARHVAFGRISLKDYYRELTDSERNDREEFVVDACYLMRDRFRGEEVFETLGLDVQACAQWVDTAPMMAQFRAYLFSRIVPIVKDIGLWGPKVQMAFADMGVIDMAGIDIDALMKADEDQAESLEQAHAEMARRAVEVDGIIATGAA